MFRWPRTGRSHRPISWADYRALGSTRGASRSAASAQEGPLLPVPLFDANLSASLLPAFKESLERRGGQFLEPPALGNLLVPIPAKIAGAKVVCSTVPEIAGNRDIARINAPWELVDVEFAVVRTSFAGAETGSVLLGDASLCVNALAYLAPHLIVLLDPIDLRSVARIDATLSSRLLTSAVRLIPLWNALACGLFPELSNASLVECWRHKT
jgi:hypothetical protein